MTPRVFSYDASHGGNRTTVFHVGFSDVRDMRSPDADASDVVLAVRISRGDPSDMYADPPIVEALGAAYRRLRQLGFVFTATTLFKVTPIE